MTDSTIVNLTCGTSNRYSAVTWATGFTSPDIYAGNRTGQYLGGTGWYNVQQDMGWDSARVYFYNALIATDASVREAFFIKTFRSAGQVLHMLQDMAVPAHVRNDMESHLFNAPLWNLQKWGSNHFEKYVVTHSDAINSTPVTPAFTGIARISDFWDKNIYDGTNPSATQNQGLAEFTNANYFSQYTIPKNNPTDEHLFPNPQITNANYICTDKLPGSKKLTKYISRKACPTDGSSVDHFAAVSLLNSKGTLVSTLKNVWLDDNVHNTYAKELLPRAVDYSAALLDYFFRGKLEIEPVTSASTFQHFFVKIKNSTTTGEEMTGGDLALVIKYRLQSETGGVVMPPSDSSPYYYKVVNLPGQYSLSRTQQSELTFDLNNDPLPFFATDVTLQVVYHGQLGNEAGSVAVGTVPLTKTGTDIALSLPASGVYATAAPNSSGFSHIAVNVTSASDLNQPDGLFELALKYRMSSSDPFQGVAIDTLPVDPASFYVLRANEANGVYTLQKGVSKELAFDLPTPLPLWASDVYINVIYKRAGSVEERPLAIGQLDISEPTPVDVFNNTDRVCINNKWYVSGSPEAYAAVGVDTYGDPLDDIFTHQLDNLSFWASGNGTLALPLEPTARNLSAATAEPGVVKRLGYVLTDYTFDYVFDETVTPLDARDDWAMWYDNKIHSGTGFTNQSDRGFTGMYTIRGNKLWWGTSVIYDLNDDSDINCGWDNLPQ